MFAEIHCLICARHLADLTVGPDGHPLLGPPAGRETRPILVVAGQNGARCGRCGGRAKAERPLSGDVRPMPVHHAA